MGRGSSTNGVEYLIHAQPADAGVSGHRARFESAAFAGNLEAQYAVPLAERIPLAWGIPGTIDPNYRRAHSRCQMGRARVQAHHHAAEFHHRRDLQNGELAAGVDCSRYRTANHLSGLSVGGTPEEDHFPPQLAGHSAG